MSAGEWTLQECQVMQKCLKKNFNLDTALYSSNGVPHHFYVNVASYPEFARRVKSTIQQLFSRYPKARMSTGAEGKLQLVL
jgi:hypothetical protein